MSKYIFHIRIIVVLFLLLVSESKSQVSITNANTDAENKASISFSNELFTEAKLIDTIPQNSYDLLAEGYNFINSKQYPEAITVFNTYLIKNPRDTKIYLQVGFLYDLTKQYSDAYKAFSFVVDNSTDLEEVGKARTSMLYLKDLMVKETPKVIVDKVLDTIPKDINTELLNKGYNYINNKQYNEAISVFNTYLIKNPGDTKIHMQLGYLYDGTKKYANAYKSFGYVADYSTNPDEIDRARTSMYFMRDLMVKNAVTSVDLYFYNFYDSYYENYVANLLTHINVRLTKGIYVGPYLETYLDSKSKPDLIINDRYFDIGGFAKFNITDWMNFELRVGYVREIDFKQNSLSFKPILSMGTRLGQSTFYKERKSNKSENFYFDVYASGLYDYKFKNVFANVLTKEVLRYLTGGYSYIEFYIKQEIALDTKKLDYNNYVDLGAGFAFKPNITHFPVLFVEGLSRNFVIGSTGDYFSGDLKNIFTVRAGFLIYYNTKL